MAAEASELARHVWPRVTTKDNNGHKDTAPAKRPAPRGYIKGMALAYADAYWQWRNGNNIFVELARATDGISDRDGLLHFKYKLKKQGLDVTKGGIDALRALYVILFELGIRESDGRYYLGLDTGQHKPDEPIDGETTEAGLFQSSWNFRYKTPLALTLFKRYRDGDLAEGRKYLAIFAEGISLPKHDQLSRAIGSGDGRRFQELTKTNPKFAVEFAAAAIRSPGAYRTLKARGFDNYRFLRLSQMEISGKAVTFFMAVEALVDLHGRPSL